MSQAIPSNILCPWGGFFPRPAGRETIRGMRRPFTPTRHLPDNRGTLTSGVPRATFAEFSVQLCGEIRAEILAGQLVQEQNR